MDETLLMMIAISILVAAVIGWKSGIATALMEIAAGVIIGNIFPIELPELVNTLSELGLITQMFMAGLEIDLSFLKQKGKESIKIGIISYTIPFAVIGLAVYILFDLSFQQTILFSLALSTSSVGIIYTILRRKGILGPRRKLILSSIMVTEFISMVILGLYYSDITWTVLAVLFFIILATLGYGYLQKSYHPFQESTTENISIKFILAILLIAEFLASGSGVDVILIVFILGMLLAKYVEDHATLKNEIEAISFGFLTPIFFFATGFGISLTEFGGVFWQVAALVTISFSITFIVTYLVAKKNFQKRARITAILFNAPMSIGIVAATIGIEKGIIDHQQYLILLGTVVISSLIAILLGRYPEDKLKITKPAS
ncbi:MAG: cation:proton antiporter [bacterium]|nr:cation:proton antiporter [bacterium]